MNHHEYWNSEALKERLREQAKKRRKAPAQNIRISVELIRRLEKAIPNRWEKRTFVEKAIIEALDKLDHAALP